MKSLQSALEDCKVGLASREKDCKDINVAVTEMHTQVLEFYSGYEDAKSHVNRLKDPKYGGESSPFLSRAKDTFF